MYLHVYVRSTVHSVMFYMSSVLHLVGLKNVLHSLSNTTVSILLMPRMVIVYKAMCTLLRRFHTAAVYNKSATKEHNT